MLLLVSIRMPRRSGRSVSAVNSAMVCGFLFSNTWKSSFVRSVTKRPFLSVTVKSMLTRVTSRMMRVLGSSTDLGLLRGRRNRLLRADSGAAQGHGRRKKKAFIWINYNRSIQRAQILGQGGLDFDGWPVSGC